MRRLAALTLASALAAAWSPLALAQPDMAPRALEPEELDAATLERIALRFELDTIVYELLERSQVPGMVVSVAFAGEVVAAEAYGSADLAAGRALALSDPLWLASLTKVLTAIVVLDLAADGLLDLDDPVERWLPEVAAPAWRAASTPAAASPITLRHLLTHTAGYDVRSIGTLLHGATTNPPLADIAAAGLPPRVHAAGERLVYCNLCYALLGMVIEAATGQGAEEAFRQRLFGPLSLSSGRLLRQSDDAHEAATARPHGRTPGGIRPLPMPALADPTAGQARLSGDDIGRLLAALTAADPPAPLGRGVREALLASAYRVHPDLPGWTLGMSEGHVLGHQAVLHGGDLPGAHSLVVVIPRAALAIFVHVNGEADPARPVPTADGLRDVRWALVEGLVALLLGDAREPPSAGAGGGGAVAGPYRVDRYPRTSAEKLLSGLALAQAPLAVESDGAIVLRPPPVLSSERRYLAVGDGILLRDHGGDAVLVDRDASGRPLLHMVIGSPLTVELVPPLERLSVVAASVGAFVLAAVLVLLSWPIGAYARWRRRSPRADDAPASVRRARWAARAVAVAGLAVLGLVATMVTGTLTTMTLEPALLRATWVAVGLTAVLTLVLAAATLAGAAGAAGRRQTWAFHGIVALAAAALLVQAWVWNLTPWG